MVHVVCREEDIQDDGGSGIAVLVVRATVEGAGPEDAPADFSFMRFIFFPTFSNCRPIHEHGEERNVAPWPYK